ncbi:MAG: hypothetical protein AB8B97_27490 [Granulosicoccus sp.]
MTNNNYVIFQMIRFNALFAALALQLLFSFPTIAGQVTLEDRQWSLLTIPANAEAQTVESLFADDLPINSLGASWAIYLFDQESQSYTSLSQFDSLPQGKGFWIVQATDASVVIDVPDILPSGTALISSACASMAGCFPVNLSESNGAAWAIVGAPFNQAVKVNDIRLQSNEQQCANGCSLSEARNAGLLSNNQWVYTAGYTPLSELIELQPWQAFWIYSTPDSSDIALTLLLPAPDPEPVAGFTKADFLDGYRGAFRLPPGSYFSESYGSTGLAVSTDGQYLFMMGFQSTPVDGGTTNGAPILTKIAIPQGDLSALPSATLVDELDLGGRLQTGANGSQLGVPGFGFEGPYDNTDSYNVVVDDLVVIDEKIIGSAYIGYDAARVASHSHFIVDSLDVSSANVTGLFNIAQGLPSSLSLLTGNDAGYIAGYMAEVPDQWRTVLGGKTLLGGQAGLSIAGRTNAGPAAYLFNASDVGDASISVSPLAHYSLNNPLEYNYPVGDPSPVIDESALFNVGSYIEGVFFAPGTDSVVFIGSTAAEGENSDTAKVYYGSANVYEDQGGADFYRLGKGPHSFGGKYEYQAWIYNINDYASVLNGELSPEALGEPEDYFRFRFGNDVFGEASKARYIGGVSLHQASGRLYVTEKLQGQTDVVHVFDM